MSTERRKFIIAVGDGMADEPIQALGGKTPLEAACTANLDFLAANGMTGLLRTVPEGMPPGSDVANLSLMGYSPREHYTGRAPLEAASQGVRMEPGDLAFRCNLVTLEERDGERIMGDYSGGGITTSRAREHVAALNDRLAGPDLRFYPGVAYRHLLVLKGAGDRYDGLETTPPHDISGKAVFPFLPRGRGEDRIASLLEEGRVLLTSRLSSLPGRAGEGTANAIWLWGQGRAPRLPTLKERFGIAGATVCAVDLVKGLGICAGLDPIRVPGATGDLDTNFQGKAVAALQALAQYDLVFLHVEAPDEAGHRGILEEKVRAIERFDREVIGLLRTVLARRQIPYRMLVLPDHPTPLRTRTHSSEPVPFLLYPGAGSLPGVDLFRKPAAAVAGFNECEARKTGIFLQEGYRVLDLLFSQPALT